MKIELEATAKLVFLDGVRCRVWEGKTESGTLCKVFVYRLAVQKDADCSQFDRELQEKLPPGHVVNLRQIL